MTVKAVCRCWQRFTLHKLMHLFILHTFYILYNKKIIYYFWNGFLNLYLISIRLWIPHQWPFLLYISSDREHKGWGALKSYGFETLTLSHSVPCSSTARDLTEDWYWIIISLYITERLRDICIGIAKYIFPLSVPFSLSKCAVHPENTLTINVPPPLSPLSPGRPLWPLVPGKPGLPDGPCSPGGPGGPLLPGSPGGPVTVRTDSDGWTGIWYIEL